MSSVYSQPLGFHDPSAIDWLNFENRWPATIDDLQPEYDFTKISEDLGESPEGNGQLPESQQVSHFEINGDSAEQQAYTRSATPEASLNYGLVVRKTRNHLNAVAPALTKSKSMVRSVSSSLRKTSAKVFRSASDGSRKRKREAVYGIEDAARKYGAAIGLGDKYFLAGVVPFEGT